MHTQCILIACCCKLSIHWYTQLPVILWNEVPPLCPGSQARQPFTHFPGRFQTGKMWREVVLGLPPTTHVHCTESPPSLSILPPTILPPPPHPHPPCTPDWFYVPQETLGHWKIPASPDLVRKWQICLETLFFSIVPLMCHGMLFSRLSKSNEQVHYPVRGSISHLSAPTGQLVS